MKDSIRRSCCLLHQDSPRPFKLSFETETLQVQFRNEAPSSLTPKERPQVQFRNEGHSSLETKATQVPKRRPLKFRNKDPSSSVSKQRPFRSNSETKTLQAQFETETHQIE